MKNESRHFSKNGSGEWDFNEKYPVLIEQSEI